MPDYTKGRTGKLQTRRKWGGFNSPDEMSKWLTRIGKDDSIWVKHFKEKANTKTKPFFHSRTRRKIMQKHPAKLAGDVVSELRQYNKGKNIGGGIMEFLHFLASSTANILGINKFKEWIGDGYSHREIPEKAQIIAKAIEATYSDKSKRPSHVKYLTRLPDFDDDRFSVWSQPDGKYIVTIHGTEMNLNDLIEDGEVIGGKQIESPELQQLFDELDARGNPYTIASHSLATQFATNSTHKNADEIYLFNPAASPLMSPEYLQKIANDPKYTYFVNPSDIVSQALFQNMNNETITNNYIAPYMYSELASHSLSQWYAGMDLEEKAPVETKVIATGETSED